MPTSDMEPNFGRFDTETKEEKEHAYLRFRVKQLLFNKLERFWRPIRRVLMIFIILAIIMAGLIGISAIPKKISLDYPAVEYRTGDSAYVEHTRIRVDGKLYTRWFSDPKFKGNIIIDKYPLTKQYDTIDITFYKDSMDGVGYLSYAGITSDHAPFLTTFGIIGIEDKFEQISIQIFEPVDQDSKSLLDLVLSAPASTREEADAITKRIE